MLLQEYRLLTKQLRPFLQMMIARRSSAELRALLEALAQEAAQEDVDAE